MALSVDDTDFSLYLNYWSNGVRNVKRVSEVCGSLKLAMTLEVSKTGDYVFLAGSTNFDLNKGRPIVSAIKFDEGMKEEVDIKLADKEMKNVYQIKRIPGGGDTVIASGEKGMSIVEFLEEEKKFLELKMLRNVHNGDIYDFGIRGKDVFSVSCADDFIHKF